MVRHIRKSSERDWAAYLESAIRSSGLTQAELARRSGLAESMVSRWLRGLNQPDVPNLRRVRPVLGVPMLELLVAAGHLTLEESQLRDTPEPPAPVLVGIATDGLTAEQVRQVEAYVAFLRAQSAAVVRMEAPAKPQPAETKLGESGMADAAQPLRYAAYGGARLTREQQERVREQARRAREEAERTGQPVVYLDDPGEPEG
ncbi:MAG TPA: helix-turn-helix domain-containing protein [Mycobacteriales bacterium]|nr:helix-turn-helix domain-containing protein [Mycobacteriales bacterium]